MESSYVYAICAVVATVIFLVIGFFLVKTLIATIKALRNFNATMLKMDDKIDPIVDEVVKLLENHNSLAESVQDKLVDLDPLMDSISDVGSALHNVTNSFSDDAPKLKFFQKEKRRGWQDSLGDLVELAMVGVSAWKKIKKRGE